MMVRQLDNKYQNIELIITLLLNISLNNSEK